MVDILGIENTVSILVALLYICMLFLVVYGITYLVSTLISNYKMNKELNSILEMFEHKHPYKDDNVYDEYVKEDFQGHFSTNNHVCLENNYEKL